MGNVKVWAPYVVKSVEPVQISVGESKVSSGKQLVTLQPAGGRARAQGRLVHQVDAHDPPDFTVGQVVQVTLEPRVDGTAPFGREPAAGTLV